LKVTYVKENDDYKNSLTLKNTYECSPYTMTMHDIVWFLITDNKGIETWFDSEYFIIKEW
jgi:hypothetical protein